MEWRGNGASFHPGEESSSDPASAARDHGGVYPHQQSPSSRLCDCAMASLCQSQQRCVKASIVSSWRLAEAQDQLCSLGVHSSESLEQERARTLACPTELTHTEEEWRRKESMLGGQEPNRSPVLGTVGSWDVFDKKEALMEQVAHQAVVMQFILEMALTSQQDPRGCFRQFFHKAKEGQDVYLEVFHTELEAFKNRVREYTVRCRDDTPNNIVQHSTGPNCRLDPKESLDSLPPVAEYPTKRCLEAGLWTSTGRWTKDDTTETEDIRMMETS
ncbi:hsp90 co-chaperone Cdc37-like 1 isoform X3 [Toxotes jaculatrix]|uniref:hsp90 co-chaperone Cdc37-like 1 isoform X3 n=1 Tax=Toxotes jaculatrix TaxID=941984 RepID=UPI001B3AEDA7|nr:hsp90 co-chaperone Cdc37-like 1 isoform X3 [Toxotes jaculatrix]